MIIVALWPLVIAGMLWWYVRLNECEQRAWAEHPDRPWNVQIRAAREHLEWHQREYRRHAP